MDLLYSVNDVVETYGVSISILRNYRWKNKIGRNINGRVYLTLKELQDFLDETELKNEGYRERIYEIIKENPSIKEKELHKMVGLTRAVTASLLADMTYMYKYKDLYEDDFGRLYVAGYDKVEEGLF